MCGICGRINFEGGDPHKLRNQIERMMRLLEHRGPDHGGSWSSGTSALGYRRLRIIDLSPTGNQPVFSENGHKILVFNGEIYNFLELKRQFASELRFFSNSDTEVVMRLYEKFGEECLKYLRGMFAFAIWDVDRQQLFLARDRAGKKPVFYSLQKGNFIFSSELRTLLLHDDFQFTINPDSIYHYLSLQYIPSPDTIFKEVLKLPPAHYAIYKNGEVTTHQYWHLDHSAQNWTENSALERFEQLLKEAVSLRLISDVPLGAFLSGGIDSSTIVSAMSSVAADRVKTFNISFEEKEFDEAPFARTVAEKFQTDHHQLTVEPDHTEIIPRLVWHYSEPYADSSAIPFYYLCRMARNFVTVALTGDGGDELFGGYPRYLFAEPRFSTSIAAPLLRFVARQIPINLRYVWRFRKWMEENFLDVPAIYFQKICYFNEADKRDLFSPTFNQQTKHLSSLEWFAQKMDRFDQVPLPENLMATDIENYLPDDLLVKADVASMACSVEVRSPFLDQEMMEFAASLPVSLKIRNQLTKYLLRTYLQGKIPEEMIHRPKQGFGVPLKFWFRHELRQMTHDILLSKAATERGYFKRSAVEKLIHRHSSGLFDNTYKLYALLILEIWHVLFMDQRISSLSDARSVGMLSA
jgi:asparagine synthase (glutamine-hydrolysing)